MAEVIVHTAEDGNLVITFPCNPNRTVAQIASDVVPDGTPWHVVDSATLPTQPSLRNAFEYNNGVSINIDKAKDIAHGIRRKERNNEFKPYDDIIAKQIPGEDATEAEAQRALIRAKYATYQTNINACTDANDIQAIIDEMRS